MRINGVPWILAIGLAAVLLTGCEPHDFSKDSEDSSAPNISVEYYPSSKLLGPTESVVVDFNYQMARDDCGFGNSLGNHPHTHTWDPGNRIVTLTPDSTWPAGADRSLFIFCKTASREYSVNRVVYWDVGALPTYSTSWGYNDINDTQGLTISFSYAMDAATAQWSGTLADHAVMQWSPNGMSVQIAPTADWPLSSQTLRLQAKTADYGDTLDTGLRSIYVRASVPGVTADIGDPRLGTTQPTVFTFTEAMNPDSIELVSGMGNTVGSMEWSEGNSVLTISPLSQWPYGEGSLIFYVSDLQENEIRVWVNPIVAEDGIEEDATVAVAPVPGWSGGGTENFDTDGSTMAIGTYQAYPGVVDVFTKSDGEWTLVQQLTPADPVNIQYFGRSVAVNGDYIAVGARFYIDAYTRPGVLYLFHRVDGVWQEMAKIVDDQLWIGADSFAANLLFTGNTLVVSDDTQPIPGGANRGAVYFYDLVDGTWARTGILQPEPTAANESEGFGYALAASGDTLLVGARYYSTQGAVYVYTRISGTWGLENRIDAAEAYTASGFSIGGFVAVDGDTALIGHAKDGQPVLMNRADGVWTPQLLPASIEMTKSASVSVAVAANSVAVGLSGLPYSESGDGAVLIYRKVDGAWNLVEKRVSSIATDRSLGLAVQIVDGTVYAASYSYALNNRHLHMYDLP